MFRCLLQLCRLWIWRVDTLWLLVSKPLKRATERPEGRTQTNTFMYNSCTWCSCASVMCVGAVVNTEWRLRWHSIARRYLTEFNRLLSKANNRLCVSRPIDIFVAFVFTMVAFTSQIDTLFHLLIVLYKNATFWYDFNCSFTNITLRLPVILSFLSEQKLIFS